LLSDKQFNMNYSSLLRHLVIIFLISVQEMNAQVPVWEDNGYGLMDESGKIIFPPVAVSEKEVRYNLIIYRDKHTLKQGLISKSNKVIIPAEYDQITRNDNGFILEKNYIKGFADHTGKIILQVLYSGISFSGSNTLIVSRDSLAALYSLSGKAITPFEYSTLFSTGSKNRFGAKKNNKYGVLDTLGKTIIPFEYDDFSYSSVGDLFIVQKDNKHGIIDINNQVILPVAYDHVLTEYNPISSHIYYEYRKGPVTGLLNAKGKKITEPVYSNFSYLNYDYILALTEKQVLLMDSTGKVIIPFCERIDPSADPDFFFAVKNGLTGVYTSEGKLIIPHLYKEISDFGWDKVFRTAVNKKEICFNSKGQQVKQPHINIDSLKKKCDNYSFVGEQLYAIKKAGKWASVNIYSGKTIIPFQYDSLYSLAYETFVLPGQKEAVYGDWDFMERQLKTISSSNSLEGAVYAIKNKKAGVFDQTGKIIIPFDYDEIRIFFKNRAIVKQANKYGVIDGSNKILIPVEYDTIYRQSEFSGDTLVVPQLIIAKKNNKYGVIDTTGRMVVDFIYDALSDFSSEGFSIVKKDDKTGVIDQKGNYLVKVQDLPLDNYRNHLGVVSISSDPVIYVNPEGKEIWHNKDRSYFLPIGFHGHEIPENIGFLKELEYFGMRYTDPDVLGVNNATTLPPGIYHLPKLKTLDLDFIISSLSPEIKNLTVLKTLNISYLGSRSIPKEIGELPLLDSLTIETYLDNYEISYTEWGEEIRTPLPSVFLPSEIKNLNSLRYLKSRLRFKALPAHLKYLSLEIDSVQNEMYREILNCSELEKLEMENGWSSDSMFAFFIKNIAGFKNLKKLTIKNESSFLNLDIGSAAIDTIKLYDLDKSISIPAGFAARQINYLATNTDSLYFPNLLFLSYNNPWSDNLPAGLRNCEQLKKLDIHISTNTDWQKSMQELSLLNSMETLQITLNPSDHSMSSYVFPASFYESMHIVIKSTKLKNLIVSSYLLDESTIMELKNQFSELSVRIMD
jgi:hypothetical protein